MDFMDGYRVRRATLSPDDALIQRHAGEVYDADLGTWRPQRAFSFTSTDILQSRDAYPGLRPLSVASSLESFSSSFSGFSNFSTAPSANSFVDAGKHAFLSAPKRSRSTVTPTPVFKKLPAAIYDAILEQLKIVHLAPFSHSCDTCYMRDLCHLALTSRAWDRAVRTQLYDRIHIVGQDAPAQLKKAKLKSGVRLKLLRRTLRERRVLAQLVRELKMPNLPDDANAMTAEEVNVVASIVMACPNLERLVNFHPPYTHEFDRLTYALSTRRKLKEHMWIIGENSAITARSHQQLSPGLMDPQQVSAFLHFHAHWQSLTTLVIHSQPNAILEHHILLRAVSLLPALQHLHASSFDHDDFNDLTLLSLPPLRSLRLQSLPGISSAGLSRYASLPDSQQLSSLGIVDLLIPSLLTISKILSSLPQLTTFTLALTATPTLPPDAFYFPPLLASATLTTLHWQIHPLPTPDPTLATIYLATSIDAGGFPSLRSVRVPADPQGHLQALCRPRAQIALPADKYAATSSPPSSLYAARQAAQARLDAARHDICIEIVIADETGTVRFVDGLPGFMGTIGSRISYSLRPALPGADEALAQVEDLRVGEGRREREGRDCCSGLWNASHPAGKRWWEHQSRPRWRGWEVEKLFRG